MGQKITGSDAFRLMHSFAFTAWPGGTRYGVSVKFFPQAVGSFDANLVISSNDPAYPEMNIALKGRAEGIEPSGVLRIIIEPPNLSWGEMQLTVHAVDDRTLEPINGSVRIKLEGQPEVEAGTTNRPFNFVFIPRRRPVPGPGIGVIVSEKPYARIVNLAAPYAETRVELKLPDSRPVFAR